MAGYAQRIITEKFPDLVGEGDSCWVTIRNPKLIPPGEMRPKGVKYNDAGEAEDPDSAEDAANTIMAKLIIGMRVYDPTTPIKLNPDTGELIEDEETVPQLLPSPPSGPDVAKLPMVIYSWLGQEMAKANPRVRS